MTYPAARLHPAAQRDNWRFRWRVLGERLKHHAIAGAIEKLAGELDETDYREANQEMAVIARDLRAAHVHLAFDEDKIRTYAENWSRLAGRLATLEARSAFAVSMGIELPKGRSLTESGIMQRLEDSLWWRRQLRKKWTRAAEDSQRRLGMVRKGKAAYASDDALKRRRAQKRKMHDWLDQHEAVNVDTAEKLDLARLAEHSLANPALRRMEFMTRVYGLEELAKGYNHDVLFITMTTPSRFHAELADAGRNPNFDRSTVRDGQKWLTKMWARARAKFKRRKMLVYGFRVAEPHHDATPHWHGLFFARREDMDQVRALLTATFLKDTPDEPGARERRIKFQTVDPKKGSPTGYLAKYLAKNIDAKGGIENEPSDETGERIADTTTRVDAWASTHGVRQFQEFGTPPVGLYREARRLRSRVQDPDLERARDCADRGRYARFVQCVGGLAPGRIFKRRATGIRLERVETGQRNRYGEERPPAIIGLRCASAVAITRPHRWRVERKICSSSPLSSHLGPVAITVRGAAALGEPAAWSNPNETSQAGPK